MAGNYSHCRQYIRHTRTTVVYFSRPVRVSPIPSTNLTADRNGRRHRDLRWRTRARAHMCKTEINHTPGGVAHVVMSLIHLYAAGVDVTALLTCRRSRSPGRTTAIAPSARRIKHVRGRGARPVPSPEIYDRIL